MLKHRVVESSLILLELSLHLYTYFAGMFAAIVAYVRAVYRAPYCCKRVQVLLYS